MDDCFAYFRRVRGTQASRRQCAAAVAAYGHSSRQRGKSKTRHRRE